MKQRQCISPASEFKFETYRDIRPEHPLLDLVRGARSARRHRQMLAEGRYTPGSAMLTARLEGTMQPPTAGLPRYAGVIRATPCRAP